MSRKTRDHLKIALVGAGGRMGQEIEKLSGDAGVRIVARIHTAKDWKNVVARNVDVVVDFSTPEGLDGALEWCSKQGVALVSGSTGINDKQRTRLKTAAKKIPVLYSGNMSLGIAVFSAMIKSLSAVKDWNFQIEEVHHIHKKDSPSGTALLLQRELTATVGKTPDPLSIRGGGVPGIHTLLAMGPEETLSLTHTAFNRQVFARGALRAAFWLFDKEQAGLYDLSDLYT